MFTYLLNRLTQTELSFSVPRWMRLLFTPSVRALALGCFYSHITQTFRRALTSSVDTQLRGDNECPFSGVTKSGRVWRKVPESDARSPFSGVIKSGRVWRRVPESDARSESLSGTFLQTLPDLVKQLKGHSLSPRGSCLQPAGRGQRGPPQASRRVLIWQYQWPSQSVELSKSQ